MVKAFAQFHCVDARSQWFLTLLSDEENLCDKLVCQFIRENEV